MDLLAMAMNVQPIFSLDPLSCQRPARTVVALNTAGDGVALAVEDRLLPRCLHWDIRSHHPRPVL
jgi:hypothetical protein